ncbi:hypothetical protein, partial [Olavius algarvensis spirochete endosymbiont]|uniref:hypothetical protein n=1 Tax=Olavius algarvensis spirochete endosymbiont TaxID=260710 RepID=UPI001E444C81
YTSTDSGVTWTDRSISDSTIAGDKNWNTIAMSSDGSKLTAGAWRGHLYTSTDSGATWMDQSDINSTIAGNRNWDSIAMLPDGSRIIAVVNGEYIYGTVNPWY